MNLATVTNVVIHQWSLLLSAALLVFDLFYGLRAGWRIGGYLQELRQLEADHVTKS